MPKFAANLSMLFTEVPFVERFGAAAAHGFRAVEYVSPYDFPAEQIAALLHENDLEQALFNLPAGDWAAGERGIACLPNRAGEFQDGVERAIAYAKVLGSPIVNCLAGIKPAQIDRDAAFESLVGNLKFADRELRLAGLQLVVEPINCFDMPGYFLNTSKDALTAIDAAGGGALLQYDVYHMQRMEGELALNLERLMPRIGHIQIAGNPGRTEPDRGEINYDYIFPLIDKLGYQGWIGAEYRPVAGTVDGLGWLKKWNQE